MTLTPGTYTAIVQGHDPVPGDPKPASGTALVELYDLSPIIAKALENLSTRGAVQGTADPMIAGFILGNGDNVTVLLRALGPSLAAFGLTGLSDPRLDLYDGEGNLLASNDNWQDTQSADIAETGLAPDRSCSKPPSSLTCRAAPTPPSSHR